MNKTNKPKKSTAMRIVVLALAGIMTLGIIVLPFLQ